MPRRAVAHGAMLLFTALIATSFTVGGMISREIAPEALTFLRFLIAAAIFLGLVLAQRRLAVPSAEGAIRYAVIGLLLAIYFVSMFVALRYTDPVSAGAVFTLVPFMSAIIAWPLNGQANSGRVWIGLLIGCAGALWVLFDGDIARLLGFHIGRGEAIFLAGCAAYATYAPAVKKLHRGESLAEINFFALVSGAAITGIYGFPRILATDWAATPWPVYLGILHLAIATTAISFALIKYASLRLPAAKVMAYTYLLPAVVAAYEGVIGHGWPPPAVAVGIAVTAAAVAVIETDATAA